VEERVARLRRARPGSPLVDVVLESGRTLRVHDRRLGERSLAAGAWLDADELAELERAARADGAEARLLRLLGSRGRSRSELAMRLRRLRVDEPDAGAILERLERLGLVDDRKLARDLVERRRARGDGRRRIASELVRLGLGAERREALGVASDEEERERAGALLRARLGEPPYGPRELRRAASLLTTRGYAPRTIAEALGLDEAG
jgi:SOS response regulatory protein OraA/RecX